MWMIAPVFLYVLLRLYAVSGLREREVANEIHDYRVSYINKVIVSAIFRQERHHPFATCGY
jgi:hypothetical protein